MVHADSLATLNRHWLRRGLWCAVLLLNSPAAWGEAYQAQDESLQTFFSALSVPLGLPVVISPALARKRISGLFDLEAPQQVVETLARQEGLIWHSDGQVLHLYDASEARSSAVVLRHISVNRLSGIMRRTGFDDSRYPLRESGGRTFYVSGPPSYVDHVMRLAQLMDRPRRGKTMDAYAFGVIQLLNTHVEDRQYGTGANTARVPGMVSTIHALLSSEQRRQLADGRLTLMAYPDTNSVLVKGTPAQVRLIEKWVAERDVPKPPNEVSLWRANVGRVESELPGELPPLTAAQHERVRRAFLRPDRELSP
ncbi:secretin N-terminal domain-containing protein [Pseudomonas sp. MWU15-20650]|uniref:secretin N-terminal domain-containing protein n=1 Tax=Pseudomonas sp. MWU15-20650 TaxID=2933107 RepID=UPI00200E32C4|nr:secretin N-terminal domain-containing protein [Pseudomonas sp. MWU15-20650]